MFKHKYNQKRRNGKHIDFRTNSKKTKITTKIIDSIFQVFHNLFPFLMTYLDIGGILTSDMTIDD